MAEMIEHRHRWQESSHRGSRRSTGANRSRYTSPQRRPIGLPLATSTSHRQIEGVVRDGMFAGDIVHEIRQLFDCHRPNPRAVDLNRLIEQVIKLQAQTFVTREWE
jgi:hypothetical protein